MRPRPGAGLIAVRRVSPVKTSYIWTLPPDAPSVREEIEARPGSVASCPQVVDEILVAQADADAAKLRDDALNTFKDQTERPLDWYKTKADGQVLADHPSGLQSEQPGPVKGKKRRDVPHSR